jgi:predicted nucleic acid-binding protein
LSGGRAEPLVLDTDILSELCRGNPLVTAKADEYLGIHGRLTITAISVFERLRGYQLAIRQGKPYHKQLSAFEAFVSTCLVLEFDSDAADRAAILWGHLSRSQKTHIGDVLIAGIAASRQIPIVTRNRRDFEPMTKIAGVDVQIRTWNRAGTKKQ